MKEQKSFKLKEDAIFELKKLQQASGKTQTKIVEEAIDFMYYTLHCQKSEKLKDEYLKVYFKDYKKIWEKEED